MFKTGSVVVATTIVAASVEGVDPAIPDKTRIARRRIKGKYIAS